MQLFRHRFMLRKVFVKWQKFAVARRPRVLTDEEELQIKFLINWQAKIKRRKELMRSQSLDSLDLTETFAKKREKDFDEDEEEISGVLAYKARKKAKYMTTESVIFMKT